MSELWIERTLRHMRIFLIFVEIRKLLFKKTLRHERLFSVLVEISQLKLNQKDLEAQAYISNFCGNMQVVD